MSAMKPALRLGIEEDGKMANALDVSTDHLMNGTTADLAAENIQDKTLINQFNRITEL